jgi:YidC/Oxa1 family membrane protein insertase
MEKRAFIAILLSLVILVAWQEYISRFYPAPPEPQPPAEPQAQKAPASPPVEQAPAPQTAAPGVPAPPVKAQGAKEIKIETDDYVAVLTTHGARLKSYQFKHYQTDADPQSPLFELINAAPGVPLPLGMRWQSGARADDGDLLYGVSGGDLQLTGTAKGTLLFQAQAPDGTILTKSFTFSGTGYLIQMEVSAKAPSGNALTPEILLTEKSDHRVRDPGAPFEGFIALVDNKIKREATVEPNKPLEFTGDVSWAGFGHTYFFFAALPDGSSQSRLSLANTGTALIVSLQAQSANGPQRYTLFAGPKEIATLEAVGRGIEKSIDFGWFSLIAIPLLYVLHFFHRFTGSYGIDIILLTVVIKVLMAPLTHKSFVSMKAMQKLAPQMEKLKERYKDDKEKLNREIMELYRRNGVNPLGGCLPMALQFPVFIGLYNALSTPIELRHAPFLWINDLSQPDWKSLPFTVPGWWPDFLPAGIPVLTILMGASMFVQQWMTPSAGDPNQRKMMLMMPLIFTFMFVTFPAGLTIYWLVNNILSIAQQYWINRQD